VVEDTPTEDETPSQEEIEGDITTNETPNDENAPAEDDSSNGDIPDDTTDAEDEPVEDNPTEDETEEDVPVDTPTDETTDTPSDETTDAPTDTPTDAPVDTPTDEPVDVPTDTPTDEPVDVPTDVPTDDPVDVPTDEPIVDTPTEDTPVEEVKMTLSELVAKWLEDNADTISLIVSIVGAVAVMWKKSSDVLKAMGIINNNAVTVANDSATQIAEVKDKLVGASESITSYNDRMTVLLDAFNVLLGENKNLKEELLELKNYLKISANSNIEFSNELAELISLSNIPNYKKDEIGESHIERVRAILDAVSAPLSASSIR
jgi:hypothetical protein